MSTLYVNAGLVPTQKRFPNSINNSCPLSFQNDPSLTPLRSHKINCSCGPRCESPKVSNLETSLANARAQSVLSRRLEEYGLDIVSHSLMYAPERRPVRSTFDIEYTKAHRLEVQAIPASEMLYSDLLLDALEADRARPNCYH